MQRLLLLCVAAMAVLSVTACGAGASASPTGPAPTLTANSPKIVAKDVKFTTTAVTAPANSAFTIDFDNQDAVPHNVSITSAAGQNVFKGDIFTGSGHRVYAVPALTPGAYTFKCDVHPEMTGTLTIN